MTVVYQGVLEPIDPLYQFIVQNVLIDTLHIHLECPTFDVFSLDPNGVIYRYVERQTQLDMVGKFYANRVDPHGGEHTPERAIERLQREYTNLWHVWQQGLRVPPYRVPRPFASNPAINAVLIEEHISGESLDLSLKFALHTRSFARLAGRLADLGGFLARLHNLAWSEPPSPEGGPSYLLKMLHQIAEGGLISDSERVAVEHLFGRWMEWGALQHAPVGLIHGDVTPMNIVFGPPGEVIAIDLERLRTDDAAVDLGSVIAELVHAFLRSTHHADGASSFISHFLGNYVRNCGLTSEQCDQLLRRCRFYTGCMLLRISRNKWLDFEYRRCLYAEGMRWLEQPGSGLSSSISITR